MVDLRHNRIVFKKPEKSLPKRQSYNKFRVISCKTVHEQGKSNLWRDTYCNRYLDALLSGDVDRKLHLISTGPAPIKTTRKTLDMYCTSYLSEAQWSCFQHEDRLQGRAVRLLHLLRASLRLRNNSYNDHWKSQGNDLRHVKTAVEINSWWIYFFSSSDQWKHERYILRREGRNYMYAVNHDSTIYVAITNY